MQSARNDSEGVNVTSSTATMIDYIRLKNIGIYVGFPCGLQPKIGWQLYTHSVAVTTKGRYSLHLHVILMVMESNRLTSAPPKCQTSYRKGLLGASDPRKIGDSKTPHYAYASDLSFFHRNHPRSDIAEARRTFNFPYSHSPWPEKVIFHETYSLLTPVEILYVVISTY